MVASVLTNENTRNSDRGLARSDEELLLEYRRTGNRELFSELVHRYEAALYAYLRRFLNHAEMAEDAFQGTFLQVHLNRDRFEEGRSFRTWLYSIATNQAIDLQRRNKRHRQVSLDTDGGKSGEDNAGTLANLLVSSELSPVEELDAVERRDWVRSAIAQLPESLRQTIQLVFYQGLSYREAAETLDMPLGTAKSRIHYAVARLVEMWNKREQRQQK